MYRDGKHEIVHDVKLKHNGELHRFLNPAGVPYSAIYRIEIDAFGTPYKYEWLSNIREKEAHMIEIWNEDWGDNE